MENLLELWIRTMTSQKIYFWIGTDRSGLDNISSTGFYCCNANHKIVDQISNQQTALGLITKKKLKPTDSE